MLHARTPISFKDFAVQEIGVLSLLPFLGLLPGGFAVGRPRGTRLLRFDVFAACTPTIASRRWFLSIEERRLRPSLSLSPLCIRWSGYIGCFRFLFLFFGRHNRNCGDPIS